MQIPHMLSVLWAYAFQSPIIQLYAASLLLLVIGLVYEIWRRSISLSFLNQVSLQSVEKTHPHLPSMRIVLSIILCFLALMMAVLSRVGTLNPLREPAVWIILATVFILAGTAAVLGELRWKKARAYAFSFMMGSANALMIIMGFSPSNPTASTINIWLILALLCCSLVATKSMASHWTRTSVWIVAASFFLWLVLLW